MERRQDSSNLAPFITVLTSISRLEEENTRAEAELKESFNDLVASFLETSQTKLNAVNETAFSVKVC